MFAKSDVTFPVSTTEPTRNGWKFDGWATSASAASGTYGASPKTTSITVNVNTTLYAIWNKTLTANFYYIKNKFSQQYSVVPNEQQLCTETIKSSRD